ncbi:hypothetical protein C8Q76DRAFT_764613 [Earliella scabrosa]|nr:hypothetical protein C8Q76DRAFT_764613 [Earliella scabrosa]
MARFCSACQRSFPTQRGFMKHNTSYHRFPKPRVRRTTVEYHPHLTARPCDSKGRFLDDPHADPPLRDQHEDFTPFADRPSFECAELLFEKMSASQGDVDELFNILRAKNILDGHEDSEPIFRSHAHMLDTIDDIKLGATSWTTFSVRWNGPVTADSPSWKRQRFIVHTRDPLAVMKAMCASADFNGSWQTRPFKEFNENGTRVFTDIMSAHWAWKQADLISEDPSTHGAMFTPFCLAADKTTVSVATGNQEYHPLYIMSGNVTNEMRRAHRDAVVPLAFLAIPKAERDSQDDEEFRVFKKQIYHESIRHILEPLRPGMTRPETMLCPDGHYRRSIFGIGPIIADYIEQVYLSGIVQGWCPKCQADPTELEMEGVPRFRAHTCKLWEVLSDDPGTLWDVFGMVNDVTPFTFYFPRADIHELLTPDILHQLVKGTFKDHLVAWVEEYIHITADSEAEAQRILDDIDRRIAASPSFPGLRRFPHGRNFKQWTGNDSKALMKVFVPALSGYVPDSVIRCLVAFLDFAYIARRSSHDTQSLAAMEAALQRFHDLRAVFIDAGVRPDGFSLPRQHALVHWIRMIKLFGSPNGVCTSISESKHIHAVKRPWRGSNRNKPLIQMLRTNTRLSKLAAARVEFGRRGMLCDKIMTYAWRKRLHSPKLHELLRRFLREELYPGFDEPDQLVPLGDCPELAPHTLVAVHHSATAVFHAPSEDCGPGGMHSEIVRCSPRWFKQEPRYDTVLVQIGDGDQMSSLTVARVRSFLSFPHHITMYECALVEWFEFVDQHPDPVTGMWMVKPEMAGNRRAVGVISVDSIVRSCHLLPVCGRTRIPSTFHFSKTLDAFRRYLVNVYADYHTHELLK